MKRSTFLTQVGMLGLGAYFAPSSVFCAEKKHPLIDKIAIQMYSVKEKLAVSVESAMAAIAKAGFRNVETFGWDVKNGTMLGKSVSEFSNILKKEGLKTHSGHYLSDGMVYSVQWDEWQKAADMALALGQTYLILPWLDMKKISETKGITHLIDTLNQAGELCRRNQLKLAYHNHAFEFEEKWEDKAWMYWLLEKTNPEVVDFQTDIFWVYRGGADVKKFLSENAQRIKLWHVKDVAGTGTPPESTTLGTGILPYHELLKSPYTDHLDYPVYEQEKGLDGANYEEVLKTSYDFMKKSLG